MRTYKTGKIYCLTNHTNKIYIGSTIKTLNERLSGHKYDYKRYINNKYHYVSCFEIMKEPTYEIILLEEFACNTKDELLRREGQYQQDMDCVNVHINKRTFFNKNLME